jgi:dephospho-CoA kinase
MAQQATREQRLACADLVIFNEGIDLTQLQAKVREMWASFGL